MRRSTVLALVAAAWTMACGSEVIHEGPEGGSGGIGLFGSGGSGGSGAGGATPAGVRPPPPPDGAGPGDGPGATFAIRRFFLGDTDRNGAPNPSAWKQYGFDLDGLISTKSSTDLCQPAAGGAKSAVYPDGDGGIDNAFGKLLLPIMTGLAQDLSAQMNESIAAGEGTMVIDVRSLGSGADYLGLDSRVYHASDLGGIPTWNGSDLWPLTAESLLDPGNIDSSRWPFPASYLNGHTWVASPAGEVEVRFAVAGWSAALTIHHAVLSMQLNADRSEGTMGVIAGVLDTEEYVDMMRQIAGSFDPALCSGTTFDSLADQMRQASDIMKDGSQNPNMTCDGVSIGFGFDASAARIGGVAAPVPPQPDPCG